MTPQDFIVKWQRADLSERSACHEHFIDLCNVLKQPTPVTADPEGAWYTFERGVRTSDDKQGWADVWMRGHFGWEYKRKRRNLAEAYTQLQRYREALDNPPLLVVCDLNRFEIHTNFTGTAKVVHAFDLDDLTDAKNLEVLRKLFTDPEGLRPGLTAASITEQAAERFGQLADGLRQRGVPAQDAAHFLMKLMFCMFGEDAHLLPEKVFGKVLQGTKNDPAKLTQRLEKLFEAMSKGGDFGTVDIPWFNGGLFADAAVIQLTTKEIETLIEINTFDWSSVEPSVFGTLFERTLDPAKRSQIGAHYTSKEDIITLLEPVMMTPLRREWEAVKAQCEDLWPKIQATARKKPTKSLRALSSSKSTPARKKFDNLLHDFTARLAKVKILDPACGSGNFLYVAIKLLLDLEKEVISYAAQHGESMLPGVRPTQLAGIEINPYAQELASVVIWIGYLQWMHDNGFGPRMNPVLEPIDSIKRMDAILDLSDPENPKEPEWPAADFIVGNPPFLGGKLLRTNLGDEYVDAMFKVWDERVPREADLCCYWFEKGRQQIKSKTIKRAGLLATQGIRGGANRKVLERIKETGEIFFAVSDRVWTLDGAVVHVSMIGFDDGAEKDRQLDALPIASIPADLAVGLSLRSAVELRTNANISFMGITPAGEFDIEFERGKEMLKRLAINGLPNSDVIRPYVNGRDINQRSRDQWTIDFGLEMGLEEAATFEVPFEHIDKVVHPVRRLNKRETYAQRWWIYAEPRPAMRKAIGSSKRYLATCMVAKHRIFVWLPTIALPANVVIAFATADDYSFGVLHCRCHCLWAKRQGTQLREKESGDRYTPTTCFETFPFPEPTAEQREAISVAAQELDRLRNNWLNPPEWVREEVLEFPGSVDGPWARYIDPATVKAGNPSPPAPLPQGARGEGGAGALLSEPRPLGSESELDSQRGASLPYGRGSEIRRSSESKRSSEIGRGSESNRSSESNRGAAGGEQHPHPSPLPKGEGSGIGTVRYPRLAPRDEECAKQLARRTLTNLYNERPTWLDLAHKRLDEAVFAAYGWPTTLSDDELLARLLELNLARAQAESSQA